MDFARRQLEKYGWKDGKGLGKNENGISQALKPKLKRSVAGIGHDAAADFTEHWWKTLYDKAASNVEVEEKKGKTKKIKTKSDSEFEITNNMWKLGRTKKNSKEKDNEDNDQYTDFFVKKAVLTNGGSTTNEVGSSDDEEVVGKEVKQITDEELFALCGGRTAHKGARHGLKALGKLARIEEQEKKLLEQSRFDGYSHKKDKHQDISIVDLQVVENISLNSDTENIKRKKDKKKKKKCHSFENLESSEVKDVESNDIVERNEDDMETADSEVVTKKKKKKRKLDTNSDLKESNMEIQDLKDVESNDIVERKEDDMETADSEEVTKKKKKKRKLDTNGDLQESNMESQDYINNEIKSKKSKKKK